MPLPLSLGRFCQFPNGTAGGRAHDRSSVSGDEATSLEPIERPLSLSLRPWPAMDFEILVHYTPSYE